MVIDKDLLKRAFLGFLLGFAKVLGLAALISAAFIGVAQLYAVELNFVDALRYAGFLMILVLLFGGLELTVPILLQSGRSFQKKLFEFSGGLFAVIVAWWIAPTAIGFIFPEEEPKCEATFEKKLGPITFSTEECGAD